MGQATQKQKNFAENIARTLNIDLPENSTFESISAFINSNADTFYKVQREQNSMQNQEIHDQIVNTIKIVDYAAEIGFTPVKKGRYYSLKEHDSVIIDTEKNCFWQNSTAGSGYSIGKGGSVIDFAQTFSGQTLAEIMKSFSGRVSGTNYVPMQREKVKAKEEKGELKLPAKAHNMRRVYAYLLKSRYLDQDVVQDFVDQKMLYQDIMNNCVFVSYKDDNPVFACLRGTNTDKRFIGDIANSDYEKGFYINNHSNQVIVTESVIDAMSVMTILKSKGIDYKSYDYMPLAGATKFDALINHLKIEPKDNIIIAMDNDKGGKENCQRIEELLTENNIDAWYQKKFPENTKDWNAELEYALKNNINFNEIPFHNDYGMVGYKTNQTTNPMTKDASAVKRALKERQKESERKGTKKTKDLGMEL